MTEKWWVEAAINQYRREGSMPDTLEEDMEMIGIEAKIFKQLAMEIMQEEEDNESGSSTDDDDEDGESGDESEEGNDEESGEEGEDEHEEESGEEDGDNDKGREEGGQGEEKDKVKENVENKGNVISIIKEFA